MLKLPTAMKKLFLGKSYNHDAVLAKMKTSDKEKSERLEAVADLEKGPSSDPAGKTPQEEGASIISVKSPGRVCITYGRDKIMNKQVVSLIRELGIDPLVMQDKDNASKPLADFAHQYPDVSFAIAILSADDWVYPKEG